MRDLVGSHDRLVRALDYLAEQSLLEVRAAGLRHSYRWLRPPGGPRAFTRFLTGLTSPRQTRGKLKSHPFFGAFTDVPFAEVLRRVEAESYLQDALGSPGAFA